MNVGLGAEAAPYRVVMLNQDRIFNIAYTLTVYRLTCGSLSQLLKLIKRSLGAATVRLSADIDPPFSAEEMISLDKPLPMT
jgi:hypothetical protein